MIIDSHAHLEMDPFDEDRNTVLERAREAGVEFILSVGNAHLEQDSMERALTLCHDTDGLATSVGIHPHDARIASDAWYGKILNLATQPDVWAIGEIGLDYHYDFSPRDSQRAVFRDQLIMARELSLPVIIHSREADADTMELLSTHWAAPNPGGIMHCFAGDITMARQAMALGFYISFAGNITFPKAPNLRETAAEVPSHRLLAETDSPYLAPVPRRGRRNEPAMVRFVVQTLADLHGVSLETMAQQTTGNFKKLFGKHFNNDIIRPL